jgi:hypothetical protein
LNLDWADRQSLIWTLVAGEILTARGLVGPLARLWKPAGRRIEDKRAPAVQPGNPPKQG